MMATMTNKRTPATRRDALMSPMHVLVSIVGWPIKTSGRSVPGCKAPWCHGHGRLGQSLREGPAELRANPSATPVDTFQTTCKRLRLQLPDAPDTLASITIRIMSDECTLMRLSLVCMSCLISFSWRPCRIRRIYCSSVRCPHIGSWRRPDGHQIRTSDTVLSE